MKNNILLILSMITLGTFGQQSFYDFTVKDIDGNDFAFSQLIGKKVMIVNVASKCGYTKQYKQLQEVYEQYGGDDFIIIGFPANNFLWQEPGSDEKIKAFCALNYQISFPMMSKISVKGKDMHPLYQWLTKKDENGLMDSKVKWNFQKYLIGKDGKLEEMHAPSTLPDDAKIIEWIKS